MMTSIEFGKKCKELNEQYRKRNAMRRETKMMLEEMLCEKQTDVDKFQNCVATLKELSEENKITVLKSDCDFDEVGGPGTEKPWFYDSIDFTIMDNDTTEVYSLCADTYHGRFSFVKIDKNDYELIKCPSCHADLIDYKTRNGK